jgi:hypothetical protein
LWSNSDCRLAIGVVLWSSGLHMFLPRRVGPRAERSLGALPYVVSLPRLRSDFVESSELTYWKDFGVSLSATQPNPTQLNPTPTPSVPYPYSTVRPHIKCLITVLVVQFYDLLARNF